MNFKVEIDCQNIKTQFSGGAATYAHELCSQLKKMQGLSLDIEYINEAGIQTEEPFKKVIYQGSKKQLIKWIPQRFHGPLKVMYRKYILRKHLQQIAPTAVLSPVSKKETDFNKKYDKLLLHEINNYNLPAVFLRRVDKKNVKLVTTFLDIQDLYYPEFFQDNDLVLRRGFYLMHKEYGSNFIAISEHTKKTMVESLGISPDKIKVIYLGCHTTLPYPEESFQKRVDNLGKYFIYPAKFWKHKNHDYIINVVGQLAEEFRKNNYKFILTGGFSNGDLEELKNKLNKLQIEDLIFSLGYLTENQLKILIQNAQYLFFPSLFEGFGMPVIEAMNLGCPVITSNAGSLPEICLDAAIYFDPKDLEQGIHVLRNAISEKYDRKSLRDKGFLNAKNFSWERCALETVEYYKQILNS